jgi:AcrR family transcriptional regulator
MHVRTAGPAAEAKHGLLPISRDVQEHLLLACYKARLPTQEPPMPYSLKHKQQTRERIVNSARRLVNRKGFTEGTIDEIMKNAGLTRGGFYKHFDTKEQLYAHAVRQFLCAEAPERWQRKHVDSCAQGQTLVRMIVNAYLSREHLDDRQGRGRSQTGRPVPRRGARTPARGDRLGRG